VKQIMRNSTETMLSSCNPRISVVICTYNRAAILRGALESLRTQSLDPATYEILVVDNGCTDETAQVVEQLQAKCGDVLLTLVHEPVQGLSSARNAGARRARAPFLAYMDDDARADTRWLELLLLSFENVEPLPWAVGGRTLPIYPTAKPNWFKEQYEVQSWGEQPRFLATGESFHGCNMAFRSDIIQRFGGFDQSFEMRGDFLALGDETDLFKRIWEQCGSLALFYYAPDAFVYHRIPAFKMSLAYMLKRAFAAGQAHSKLSQPSTLPSPSILRASAGMVGSIRSRASAMVDLTSHPMWQNWVAENCTPIARYLGLIAGLVGWYPPIKHRPPLGME
jgi:glycosyltransferase involved in cell wall biosynthesis